MISVKAQQKAEKYAFPDGTERMATLKNKFEQSKPVKETTEVINTEKIIVVMQYEHLQLLHSVVKALVGKFFLTLTPEGLKTRILDNARVGMADIFIPRDQFVEYYLGHRYFEVPMTTEILHDAMEGKGSVRIMVSYPVPVDKVLTDKENNKFFAINYTAKDMSITSANGIEHGISVNRDVENSMPKLPDLYKVDREACKVIAPLEKVKVFLKQSSKVRDSVRLNFDGEVLSLRASNDDDKLEMNFSENEIAVVHKGVARTSYPTDYLIKIVAALMKLDKRSEFYFSTDYPLVVTAVKNGITISYYLAPKME